MKNLDAIDKKILRLVQRNAALSMNEIAAEIGLSLTPCWKRIRHLEADGIIQQRVALLDRQSLNLGVTVFVVIKTNQHDEGWLNGFADAVSRIPEIVEFYRMSGEMDYLLKIVCENIPDYDRIYKKLIRSAKLFDVNSSFAMEQIKYTTELPIWLNANPRTKRSHIGLDPGLPRQGVVLSG